MHLSYPLKIAISRRLSVTQSQIAEQSNNDIYNAKLATLNHAQTLSLAPMMGT